MIAKSSMFAQVISLVDRNFFAQSVEEHQAEKSSKGFSSWDQFVSMTFLQMSGSNSLREVTGGLASAAGKLSHLGMKQAPARSTLSYANAHRSWKVFKDIFYHMLGKCRNSAFIKGQKLRFRNPLRSIDATVIPLCLETFDWARYRRTKGAVKLHLMLDHAGHLPCWAHLTPGKVHEVNIAKTMSFPAGTVIAMDRGYWDYGLFGRLTDEGVYFVTRSKDKFRHETIDWLDVPEKGDILGDDIVKLTGKNAEKCPHNLRRVISWDDKSGSSVELITNIMHLSPDTIAEIYRQRWQIEIFFKALKQYMKIKSFVGTTENAVLIQIWTALIVILILKYLQMKSRFGWSLSHLAAMFRLNLLTYRDLWHWLNEPFGTPATGPPVEQLELF